ncbi:MAG: hypothetical protein HY343_01450 [Lentisphaerae bacterium]|nr:hypothetical protein [Lentisphaerota bacterium]
MGKCIFFDFQLWSAKIDEEPVFFLPFALPAPLCGDPLGSVITHAYCIALDGGQNIMTAFFLKPEKTGDFYSKDAKAAKNDKIIYSKTIKNGEANVGRNDSVVLPIALTQIWDIHNAFEL